MFAINSWTAFYVMFGGFSNETTATLTPSIFITLPARSLTATMPARTLTFTGAKR